jgi:2,3-bisphosphoglycerate-independent phosphoglycerate mutase
MSKKYIIVLIDGASDYPLAELGGKTPLQVANKPVIDELARRGIVGMVKTIPEGVVPGSDSANLSILGYDPRIYSTGRSSLEAVSMGIELSENDVAFRCNLVTLSDESNYPEKIMLDYSAGADKILSRSELPPHNYLAWRHWGNRRHSCTGSTS